MWALMTAAMLASTPDLSCLANHSEDPEACNTTRQYSKEFQVAVIRACMAQGLAMRYCACVTVMAPAAGIREPMLARQILAEVNGKPLDQTYAAVQQRCHVYAKKAR